MTVRRLSSITSRRLYLPRIPAHHYLLAPTACLGATALVHLLQDDSRSSWGTLTLTLALSRARSPNPNPHQVILGLIAFQVLIGFISNAMMGGGGGYSV